MKIIASAEERSKEVKEWQETLIPPPNPLLRIFFITLITIVIVLFGFLLAEHGEKQKFIREYSVANVTIKVHENEMGWIRNDNFIPVTIVEFHNHTTMRIFTLGPRKTFTRRIFLNSIIEVFKIDTSGTYVSLGKIKINEYFVHVPPKF